MAPKSIHDHDAESWHAFIVSRHIEPAKAKPKRMWLVTKSKKGTVSLRVNRKPKYLTPDEVPAAYAAYVEAGKEMAEREFWTFLAKRKIPVRTHDQQKRLDDAEKEIPW